MSSRTVFPAKAVSFVGSVFVIFLIILSILCASISEVSLWIASALICGVENRKIIVSFPARILYVPFYVIFWIFKEISERICFPG